MGPAPRTTARTTARTTPRATTLVAAAAALALLAPAAPATGARRAAPVTAFQMPFPCGETWTGSTRPGHSPSVNAVDWNRNPDLGAPVVSAAAGVVTAAYATPRGGYGRWVVIDHGNGESTLYAHLASVVVAVGQRVDQGAMIGTLGDSGNSSGSHLHFEEKSGRSVVPAWFNGSEFRSGAQTSRNCVDVPLAGNFAGDRASEIAVFRRARKSSFIVHVAGAAPLTVRFGKAYDEPLLGDWNGDGRLDVGVRTPRKSKFKLKTPSGIVKVRWGVPSDIPVSGDWNGDGSTEIGVRRAAEGTFHQRMPDGSAVQVWLGDADDLPVTGDWDGNGTTDLGVYDQATATFTLRSVDAAGLSVLEVVQFGAAGDLPVTGDWNGDGVTDLGVWSPATATFTQGVGRAPTSARRPLRTVRFGTPRG
ncbi:M23 family metallopeptidase [Nocardioides xinjiangensis]|uniref:M23 family metallopeptidase n=1 Tax=Nocardioides xinjiangensis TaxID=2817376 RepID=UPI001B310ECB|nr:M23 family metallopeptidase [Nocardioides sp. SYSU D00514]